MRRRFLLLCLMAVSLSAMSGELYRWVDSHGKVFYGDTPPPGATLVESLGFFAEAAPDAGLPYETRRAMKNFPVTLYVADNCVEPCADARSLLSKRGVPFGEKSIRTQLELDAFKAASASDGSVPALEVGKTHVSGYNAERWQSELDFAGYPKSAPPFMPVPKLPASAPEAGSSQPATPADPTPTEPAYPLVTP